MASENDKTDSAMANHMKNLVANSLVFPFHIIPIIKPDMEPNNDSNAIHSAGKSEIIAFIIAGDTYVKKSPLINNDIKMYF